MSGKYFVGIVVCCKVIPKPCIYTGDKELLTFNSISKLAEKLVGEFGREWPGNITYIRPTGAPTPINGAYHWFENFTPMDKDILNAAMRTVLG